MANIKKDPQVIELLAKAEEKAAAAQEKAVAKALKDQAKLVKTAFKEALDVIDSKDGKAGIKSAQTYVFGVL